MEPRGIRYQAFQWAVAYPDFIDAIVPVNTAPWTSVNTDKQLAELQARSQAIPNCIAAATTERRRAGRC